MSRFMPRFIFRFMPAVRSRLIADNLSRLTSLLLALWLVAVSHAAGAQTAPKELQQLELLSYQLSSSFGAFIYFEGQQEYLQKAKQNLADGRQILTTLEGQHPQVHKLWQQAEQFIEDNTNRSFEGVDMTLEASWGLLTIQLQDAIADLTLLKYSNQAMALQSELEQILALYIKFANSTVGGYGVSRSDKSIEQRVEDVQQQIDQHFADDKRLQRKWSYIKRTVLAYNSNTAPYIVMKVFDDMRAMLRSERYQQIAAD